MAKTLINHITTFGTNHKMNMKSLYERLRKCFFPTFFYVEKRFLNVMMKLFFTKSAFKWFLSNLQLKDMEKTLVNHLKTFCTHLK